MRRRQEGLIVMLNGCPKCNGPVVARPSDLMRYCDSCGENFHQHFEIYIVTARVLPDEPVQE